MKEVSADVLRRCIQGDEEAARKIFRAYERYVYALCLAFVQDREEALDLCQESFLRLFRGLKDFDLDRPFKPWVRRVVINACINYGRKRQTHPQVNRERDSEEREDAGPLSRLPARDAGPEERLELQETMKEVRQLLKELPPEERLTLVLRHQEGLSYSQIAEVTGWPLGTVKTYLHRARKSIREKLVQLWGGHP